MNSITTDHYSFTFQSHFKLKNTTVPKLHLLKLEINKAKKFHHFQICCHDKRREVDLGHERKATIEQVFNVDDRGSEGVKAPWSMGWQMNERNIVWNDDLKKRLIKRIASDELKLSENEFERYFEMLINLLPGLDTKLIKMPAPVIVKLVSNVDNIASKLLRLKNIFPKLDVSILALTRPSLLLTDDLDDIEKSVDIIYEMFQDVDLDNLIQNYPSVLDIKSFKEAISDLERMMPGSNVSQILNSNPSMILSLQKGSNMIPYDEVPTSSQ